MVFEELYFLMVFSIHIVILVHLAMQMFNIISLFSERAHFHAFVMASRFHVSPCGSWSGPPVGYTSSLLRRLSIVVPFIETVMFDIF